MQNRFLPAETTTETTSCVGPSVTLESTETTETQPDVQAVTELLAQSKRKVHHINCGRLAGLVIFESVVVSPFVWSVLHNGYWNPHLRLYSPLFTFLTLYLPLITLSGVGNKRPNLDTETLAKIGGVKAIPTLLDSLGGDISRGDYNTRRTLTVLLPHMQATDAALLTARHRQRLNVFLRQSLFEAWMNGADYSLAVAVLKAYEQVGDAKAIPVVERLAGYRPRSEGQRKIQQAAMECLPLLRANAGDVHITQMLLRASMPDTNTPDTLLRAATSDINAPTDELLRVPLPNHAPPPS